MKPTLKIAIYTKHGLALCLLVLNFFAIAQSPVLKNFTIKDGLPSNETYSIFQDKKGFVWICTDAGLVRYDANTFKTFNSNDGLPDNTVFEVKEDKLGRIWYRTFSGGIGYVFNDSVYTIKASDSIIKYLRGGIICSFHLDDQNAVLLGIQSAQTISFLKIRPPYSADDIEIILADNMVDSWLDIIVYPDGRFVHSEKPRISDQVDLIVKIYDSRNNTLFTDSMYSNTETSTLTKIICKPPVIYMANGHTLKEYNMATGSIKTQHLDRDIINIHISKQNEFIVSYRDRGIKVIGGDTTSGSLILKNLSNSAILEDNNNGTWYCTLKNGVFYTNNLKYRMYDVSNNTYQPVRFFKPVGENKFNIGLENDGCFFYELSKGSMHLLADMNMYEDHDYMARCAFQVRPDEVLIGYMGHNHIYNYRTKKIKQLRNPDMLIRRFSDMYLYKSDLMGYGYNGAFVIDSVDFSVKTEVSSDDRITSFAYNPINGKAYFGGMHGLYKFYGQTQLEEKDKINSFRVKDLKFLSEKLFIATKGYGLVVYSGNIMDTINSYKGLLSNVCEKIFIDGNDCWISSNLGLSKVTYYGYKHYDIVNYPLRDFEVPTLIQDFFVRSGTLYFASGPMIYSYPLIEQEEHSTPFYVYSLEVNNKIIAGRKDLELDHDQSNIKLRFAALYYNFRGSVLYRYKLLPNDQQWIYTNENFILFPNLSSGSYSIILQAQKNNGSWIECSEKVSFSIQKPIWRQWWFIVNSLLVGITGVSYLTYYLYKIKVEKELVRNKIKIRLNNLEIKAMKAQMNPHFIFNSLTSIQYFILANENDNAYVYLSKFSKLVRMLLESNEKENLDVGIEIEILKKYLEIESMRLKDSFSYEFSIDPSLALVKKIPHMMIQPFVENAIWHGLLEKKEDRLLKISFAQKSENELECVVEDNGIGINKSREKARDDFKEKSLALEFIKERLHLFSNTIGKKYTLEIEDLSDLVQEETGTRVTICLPLFD